MRQATRNRIFVLIGLFGALLVVAGSVVYRSKAQLYENSQWVAHTQEVIAALEGLRASIVDAETGQRGFVITGNPEYLAPYDAGIVRHADLLAELRRLTADNPEQQARLDQLQSAASQRMETLGTVVAVRKADGFEAARDLILNGAGRDQMLQIRGIVGDMMRAEEDLLDDRRKADVTAFRASLLNTILATLVGLAALAGLGWLVNRHLRSAQRSARELFEQRELLRATLVSIGDGVIVTDEHARVTMLNAVAERLLGWTIAEAQGKPLETVFRIINEESRHAVENPAMRALREGEIVGLANHTILIAKDGTEWPLDDSAAPIKDHSGDIQGAVLVFREISERKRQENELAHKAEQLAEADHRKDEFLATLAHELRNPLAPVSNALQLWPLVEKDPAEVERLRELMERQVRQMTRLIDDLMDISRISRGKIQLHKQTADIVTLLTEAIDVVQPVLDAAALHATVALPHEPLYVEGDVARLSQVFGNLLHNAAKFTPRGGTIWISAHRREDKVVISIRDNGPGIPQNMLSVIFEMFRQGDGSLERAHGGLGIGLTLVKRLVEEHGGSVEARSAGPGQGSEFIVTLPAAAELLKTTAEPQRFALRQVAHIPAHRILVVDDVKASARTLAMMLRALGQQVSEAYDGPEGVEAARNLRPDIVFLDIAMPGMSGYDVARILRAESPTLVLAAVTGYGQEDDRRQAFDAGFNHHLVKPTSMEALEHLLVSVPAFAESAGVGDAIRRTTGV